MKSFLITNLCTNVRIKTKDDHVLQAFSGFYQHPAMVNEDAWNLQKHGNVNILVDEDTMHIMKNMLCEFGYEATSDTILTCKLTSMIEDEEERTKQWNELYEYANGIRNALTHMNQKALKKMKPKVSDLVSAMENTSISEKIDSDSGASESKT